MILETARLVLRPVAFADLPELVALKADPRAFAAMLGGVRTPVETQEELGREVAHWARFGVGMWTARLRAGGFAGIAGIFDRPDGRGLSLRFSITPPLQGRGLAREAAGASLRDALDRARLGRVVAVARADNFASRTVLGAIGMRQVDAFTRDGTAMLLYEATAPR